MDKANQSGSQQSTSGGVDVSGVETTTVPSSVSVAPKKEIESTVLSEHIKLSEPELKIHPEIAGMMEKTAEQPTLTSEHHEAGLRLSEQQPVITGESKHQLTEPLPMTETQAIHMAKTGSPDSTKSWLANLVLKVIGKFNAKKQNELNARSI